MSRTGRKPITLPAAVQIQVDGGRIVVEGPKGRLARSIPRDMSVEMKDGRLFVRRPSDSPQHRALHGLTRTLVQNMITGVTEGYAKVLELVGVGYRASLQGRKLVLNMGKSHPVVFEPGADMEIEVPSATRVVVKGIDKQQVGNFAAGIRKVFPPEPYKGKGIRYENEPIRRKVGKAGK